MDQIAGPLAGGASYPQIIVLNGASSSGKTSIAKRLLEILPELYLNFSIDSVLYALPPSDLEAMIEGKPILRPGYSYGRLVSGFHAAVAALAATGIRLIIDNAITRENWRLDLFEKLAEYDVLWVGVYCSPEVSAARELKRGDRAAGTAAREYPLVHAGFRYDVELDTTSRTPDAAASMVISFLSNKYTHAE